MKNLILAFLILSNFACSDSSKKDAVVQTRTSGTVKILVDESFSSIIADQVEVFNSDYKDAKLTFQKAMKNKIVPTF